MHISEFRNWCKELDNLLLRCNEQQEPSDADAAAIVRQLHRVLLRAPQNVKQHFHLPPEDAELELLFECDALDSILIGMTRSVGLMISRSPSGRALATIGVPDFAIECSFSSNSSLAVATAGAIAATAIELLECGPDTQIMVH